MVEPRESLSLKYKIGYFFFCLKLDTLTWKIQTCEQAEICDISLYPVEKGYYGKKQIAMFILPCAKPCYNST